jgi:general secretion pathway protein K
MSVRRQRGFALVAVLWIIAGLAALASAYTTFAINTAASVYWPQQRLQVDAALRAAVELTAYRQLSWPKASRPSIGAFSAQLGVARLEVSYRAETARIDINNAPRETLVGLFGAVGEKAAAAGFIADRIMAWRGRLDDDSKRAEASIYRKAGLFYKPAGAPFDNVLELAMLPGVSPTLLLRALPYLTVYSGSAKIDPMIADQTVLAAVPGMSAKAEAALRAGAQGLRDNPTAFGEIAGALSDFISLDTNDNFRAKIAVTFPNRRVEAEIVLLVSDSATEPYRILYWRDDFEEPR